jgi:predicted dehydrogenase
MQRISYILLSILIIGCSMEKENETFTGAAGEVKLITLDPGHFHAALIQKTMYEQVAPQVYVYAPPGADVEDHLNRIASFNTRTNDPTQWQEEVVKGPDYLKRMVSEKKGNVVVISGNNRKKTEYIKAAVEAGLHVLSDKPMCIDQAGFTLLKEAFEIARANNVLIKDIMTERFEITTILQKELASIPEVFGKFIPGSPEMPSVTKESVHHYFKYVSGKPLKRPPWYFDVTQQGEGIVDVTTHLVDLIQWACLHGEIVNYESDIEILQTKRWPTMITPEQYNRVTHLEKFPDYLEPLINPDNILPVYANGEIIYKIKNIHAKVSVIWNYQAPEGAGDTHFSIMRGTKADIIIKQGAEENYRPQIYIAPNPDIDKEEYQKVLDQAIAALNKSYPGLTLNKIDSGWRIGIPDTYRLGHEAHFGQVTQHFLKSLIAGKLVDWEAPNMLSKYYTTTKALEMAREK